MQDVGNITIISNKQEVVLNISHILFVQMKGNMAVIHILDVICFPTFKGHCGCILFDISQIKSFRKTTDTEKALALYFEKLVQGNQ